MESRVWVWGYLLVVLLQVCGSHGNSGERKVVHTKLVSGWSESGLEYEVGAHLQGLNGGETLYWNYVSAMAAQGASSTVEDAMAYATTALSGYDGALELLHYTLSLRYYSPLIQVHRALAQRAAAAVTLPAHCSSWVLSSQGTPLCSAAEIETELKQLNGKNIGNTKVELYEFDQIYNGDNNLPVFVLYGNFQSANFGELHQAMVTASNNGQVQYVLRYNVPESPHKVVLSGYGVELDIKSLEYKTIDDSNLTSSAIPIDDPSLTEDDDEETQGFLFGVLKKRKPQYASELTALKAHLVGHNYPFESLKVWQLRDIAYQASQRIASASNPLKLLMEISQNFPNHASALSKIKVNDTFKSEIQKNRYGDEGSNLLLINNRFIEPENYNPFELQNIFTQESSKLFELKNLQLESKTIQKVLEINPETRTELKYLVSPAPCFVYFNDLESDPQYHNWPKAVSEIFRRVWPGSFRYIAKNFYTAVVFANLGNLDSVNFLKLLDNVITQGVPLRWAVVFTLEGRPYSDSLISVKLTKLFMHMKDKHGLRGAMSLLHYLSAYATNPGFFESESSVETMFTSFIGQFGGNSNDYKLITESTDYNSLIAESSEYANRLGVSTVPAIFLNGQFVGSAPSSPQELLQSTASLSFSQVSYLQDMVRYGKIRDNGNIYEAILQDGKPLPRYNSKIVSSGSNQGTGSSVLTVNFAKPDFSSIIGTENSMVYFRPIAHQDATSAVTLIVALDFENPAHLAIARDAFASLKLSGMDKVRLSLIQTKAGPTLTFRAIIAAYRSQIYKKAFNFVDELLTSGQVSMDSIKELAGKLEFNMEKFTKQLEGNENDVSNMVQSHKRLLTISNDKNLSEEDVVVFANGRKLIVSSSDKLAPLDFVLLCDFEYDKVVSKVANLFAVDDVASLFVPLPSDALTSDFFSDVIWRISSVLQAEHASGVTRRQVPSSIRPTLSLTKEGSLYTVVAVINPLSKEAQKLAPILEMIRSFFSATVEIFLNPKEESSLPLKNYYVYVTPQKLHFDSTLTKQLSSTSAIFSKLPETRLLTMKMDTSERWLVTPTIAKYDLDNIKLESIKEDKVVFAQFELQNLLLEGNCYDVTASNSVSPPRGLQLTLANKDQPYSDTIVMSNFGYFQLKANPGVWSLHLKENSKSSDLYQFVDNSSTIVMYSFRGAHKLVTVSKQPHVANDDIIPNGAGIWDSISGLWKADDKPSNNETIHVFSLASGHLYERFLKIMMLSVVKKTQSPVKFWLLANFLSPKFKDFIPHMAKHYNFEYELVTYKWPSWLHKQTEKQRIIWAYKILFLDVLFPMDLKKVIYVDADQVVRSDLRELWTMDLHGAPYAYTPFCNDNQDTAGFRFWSQGFWVNHLQGSPYHISALYVVDLAEFRKQGAGDNLRIAYAQLSQDPNSLANLDQDLPNYLQHQVRIFSLPQEWLWCETWCSQSTKPKAKTIDLCNNPLTKEPKLDSAVRILPEWTGLDSDIKQLEKTTLESINSDEDLDSQKLPIL